MTTTLIRTGFGDWRWAGRYAEAMRRSGTLVLVRITEDRANEAAEIMQRYQAVDLDKRTAEWRAAGWRK